MSFKLVFISDLPVCGVFFKPFSIRFGVYACFEHPCTTTRTSIVHVRRLDVAVFRADVEVHNSMLIREPVGFPRSIQLVPGCYR